MSQVLNFVRRFGKDENGGAMIEYTALLAIILVAVISTILAVGQWVSNVWTNLHTQLQPLP